MASRGSAAETMIEHRYRAVDGAGSGGAPSAARGRAPAKPDPRTAARTFATAASDRFDAFAVKLPVPTMTIGADGAPLANDLSKWVVTINGVGPENFKPLNAYALQVATQCGCAVTLFPTTSESVVGWLFSSS